MTTPSAGVNSVNRSKRKFIIGCVIAAIVLLAICVAGVFVVGRRVTRPAYGELDQELEHLVAGTFDEWYGPSNVALFVTKGDGSLTWSGAAGIAHEATQQPMTADTPIYIASVTKLYVAAAVMRLVEQGDLSLDDPMAKHLPDELIDGIQVYEGHDYSHEITVEQLLAHTSGIADYYEDKPEGGESGFELMLADPDRVWTVDELIGRARDDLEPHFAPGTDASYSDTSFQLLGKIIEAVTAKPLHVVFEEFFFQPLDLKHTWLVGWPPAGETTATPADVFYKHENITQMRANGAYWADGGIVSTVEEMVVFLKALNEGQIVSEDLLERMHDWHRLNNLPFDYGLGTMWFALPSMGEWVLPIAPMWGHTGSTGSFLYYAPDLDLYMAGTIDQVGDDMTAMMLMFRVMIAVRELR